MQMYGQISEKGRVFFKIEMSGQMSESESATYLQKQLWLVSVNLISDWLTPTKQQPQNKAILEK